MVFCLRLSNENSADMHNQTNAIILAEHRPRRLRSAATDVEVILWRHLRARQILGAKFRRQHALADFVMDFVSFDVRLIVELDGGQHAEVATYDAYRDGVLHKLGFEVLGVWNNDVTGNLAGVLEMIHAAVQCRLENHPHPSPPLEGEGAKPC
jgi:very-short-patch-repair endonuclease